MNLMDGVSVDPAVLGGTPTLEGTRIPVYDVAASLAAGQSVSRIRAAYPALSAEQIELAKAYAIANPPPRGAPGLIDLQPDLQSVSGTKVSRRALR